MPAINACQVQERKAKNKTTLPPNSSGYGLQIFFLRPRCSTAPLVGFYVHTFSSDNATSTTTSDTSTQTRRPHILAYSNTLSGFPDFINSTMLGQCPHNESFRCCNEETYFPYSAFTFGGHSYWTYPRNKASPRNFTPMHDTRKKLKTAQEALAAHSVKREPIHAGRTTPISHPEKKTCKHII